MKNTGKGGEKLVKGNTINFIAQHSFGHRNPVLYKDEGSMTEAARAVKKYVRGLFGHDSAEYALVKALEFNKPAKN